MDPQRFDTLTRTLTDARSRRAALISLLGGTLGLLGLAETSAKNRTGKGTNVHDEGKKGKNKKKKRKPAAPTTQTPVSPPPPPVSPPPPPCADGQRLCNGTCLSVLICCDNSDCAGGRTCQNGTCACPADRPVVCAGSTVCWQCCVKADCTSNPNLTGSGIPECLGDGTCVCATSGTRYCPDGRFCGRCCSSAECTDGKTCYAFAQDARTCDCIEGQDYECTAAGRTGCVPVPGTCEGMCNAPCNPEDGDAACCPGLVCERDPTNPDGSPVCAPA